LRLKEEYKKSGYFWLPDRIENKLPGTLSILDGGDIELEVVGLFSENLKSIVEDDDLSRIIGQVERDGLVTLENCYYIKRNIAFEGISKSLIRVNQALCGVAFDKDEEIKFNSLSFTVEGLNEWLGISGIRVSYGEGFKTANIEYIPQEELVYKLENGIYLHIKLLYSLPGFPVISEAKVSERAYFKLSSQEAILLPEFIRLLQKVTYFMCFAVDSTVSILDVTANSDEILEKGKENSTRPADISVYYPSLPFSQEIPRIKIHEMLFRFDRIKDNAESIFSNWLKAYSIIRPSLGLYFSAVTGSHKFLDGKFLALAQALETYHRRTSSDTIMERGKFRSLFASLLCKCPKLHRDWLYSRLRFGNEISLGQRIKAIIEPFKSYFGNRDERKKLIRKIVVTRNYLTHYSEELEVEAAKGAELWVLCEKMAAIFKMHLFQQLGFSVAEVQEIINSNERLKRKLGEI